MHKTLGCLKYFNAASFQELKDFSHREVIEHKAYEPLALEILTRYEGFQDIQKPPSIPGTPFDYFAIRNGTPYLLVIRDPVNRLRAPSDVLRLRLKILTGSIQGLETAHYQVHLKKEFYRVIYTDEIINFTARLTRSSTWSDEAVEPILQWIRIQTQDGINY